VQTTDDLQLRLDDFYAVGGSAAACARTFAAECPVTTTWRADFYPDRPVIRLVGPMAPRPIDRDSAARRVAAPPDWARDSPLAAARGLGMLSVDSVAEAAGRLPGTDLKRDDRPVLEFPVPLTRVGADGGQDRFTGAPPAGFTDADEAARDEAAVRALVPDVGAGEESGAAFSALADLRREQESARGRREAMAQGLGELSRDRREAR
jgi:hypothetical protein